MPPSPTRRPVPPPDADRALVARAVADPAARAALVERFGPLVWALCNRLSPTPEDSWQNAWAHLLARLDRYNPERAAPATWFTTVVHRLLVDEHRRRGPTAEVLPLTDRPAPERDPGAALDHRRRLVRLEAAIQRLPPDQRRVVVLHHVHGLSLSEIATSEALPTGTIKSRLHRGRAHLARLLEAMP